MPFILADRVADIYQRRLFFLRNFQGFDYNLADMHPKQVEFAAASASDLSAAALRAIRARLFAAVRAVPAYVPIPAR